MWFWDLTLVYSLQIKHLFVMASLTDSSCNITFNYKPFILYNCDAVSKYKLIDKGQKICRESGLNIQSFQFDPRPLHCEVIPDSYFNIDFACCQIFTKFNGDKCRFRQGAWIRDNACNNRVKLRQIAREKCASTTDDYLPSNKFYDIGNWEIDNSRCYDKRKWKISKYSCCRFTKATTTTSPTTTTTTTTTESTTSSTTTTTPTTSLTTTTLTTTTTGTKPFITSEIVAPTTESVLSTKRPTYNTAEATSDMSTDTTVGLILGGLFACLLLVFVVAMINMRREKRADQLETLVKSNIQLARNNADTGSTVDGVEYEFEEVTYADTENPTQTHRTVSKRKRKKDGTITEKVTTQRIAHGDDDETTMRRKSSRRHSRRTSRHDLGQQSTSRRSRHDMKRHGPGADATSANMNPLEVLASVLTLGEQMTDRRSKNRQSDDSMTSRTTVASRRNKSSRSKRKSKRRRDDVYDDYTDNMSVTQTAKRRMSPKRY